MITIADAVAVSFSPSGPVVPVSTIDKFSTDIQRFMRWLPVAYELTSLRPSSRAAVDTWFSRCETDEDLEDLAATLDEVAAILESVTGAIRSEVAGNG